MAFQGPNVPHRTPRKIALEHGTSSAGFEGAVTPGDYNPQAGVPTKYAGGEYKGEKPLLNGSAPPREGKTPFKLGK